MAKQLKKWQGWLLFGGAMVIVFVLGLICSSLLERRAEVVSVFNNKPIPLPDVSTKEKAQRYIGLDMPKLKQQKQQFLDTVVPKWIEEARKNKRFITKPM